jgi:hypothetical protein
MPHARVAVVFGLAVALTSCSPSDAGFPADRDRLTRAFTELQTAAALRTGDSALVLHARAGLAAGDSVSDAFLDWLDPAMRVAFRTQYMAGQHFHFAGLLRGDTTEMQRGDRLIAQWRQGFWRTNGNAVYKRAFGGAH